jgi:hypothetical protein
MSVVAIQVSAGSQFSLALTKQGELWAWGKNDAGQLGLGGTIVMDLNSELALLLVIAVIIDYSHDAAMEDYPMLVDTDPETDAARLFSTFF